MADTGKDEKLYVRAFWEIRGYIMENHLRPGVLLPAEERLCARPGMKESQTPWKLTLVRLAMPTHYASGRPILMKNYEKGASL